MFERELNLYAENVPFKDYCGTLLKEMLWELPQGLKYSDRSIFVEEHTLFATVNLLDALTKHLSPMMCHRTKITLIFVLKKVTIFLETIPINRDFYNIFKEYFDGTVIEYITQHVENCDLGSVKSIMKSVYEPILNPNYGS